LISVQPPHIDISPNSTYRYRSNLHISISVQTPHIDISPNSTYRYQSNLNISMSLLHVFVTKCALPVFLHPCCTSSPSHSTWRTHMYCCPLVQYNTNSGTAVPAAASNTVVPPLVDSREHVCP